MIRVGLREHRFSASVVLALGKVPAVAWLIPGAVVLSTLDLITLSRNRSPILVVGQFPMATEAGKRLAGQAMTQIEQVAPDLKEQAGQWRRGSSKNKADAEKAA